MTDRDTGIRPVEDPEGQLERAFIDEYLRLHGHDPAAVRLLPEAEAIVLLEAASIYAGAGRLNIFGVAAIAFVAAVLGDNVGYWIGVRGGRRAVHRFGKYIFITPARSTPDGPPPNGASSSRS